jgi:hypothetical protein
MLPVTVIAAIPGPLGAAVRFGYHTFQAAADGQLEHLLDGVLWATVPPEGMTDYLATWPQAESIVRGLLGKTPAADPEAPAPGPAL